MWDIICPFCKREFEDAPWEGGKCPGCGEGYYWDEQYNEETEECWETVEWDRLDREYLECLKKKREKESGLNARIENVKSPKNPVLSSPVEI